MSKWRGRPNNRSPKLCKDFNDQKPALVEVTSADGDVEVVQGKRYNHKIDGFGERENDQRSQYKRGRYENLQPIPIYTVE